MATKDYKIKGMDKVRRALHDMPAEMSDQLHQDIFIESLEKVLMPPLRHAVPAHYSSRAKRAVMTGTFKGDPVSAWGGVSTDAYWVQWQEFGTTDRYVKGDRFHNAYRGFITGTPILQRTIYENIENVTEDVIERFKKALTEYVEKQGAKIE